MTESWLETPTCPLCEKSQDDCYCLQECPKCGGMMDVLDASICMGCDSYYGDCDCKPSNRPVNEGVY